jgi:hypothetical protein
LFNNLSDYHFIFRRQVDDIDTCRHRCKIHEQLLLWIFRTKLTP